MTAVRCLLSKSKENNENMEDEESSAWSDGEVDDDEKGTEEEEEEDAKREKGKIDDGRTDVGKTMLTSVIGRFGNKPPSNAYMKEIKHSKIGINTLPI